MAWGSVLVLACLVGASPTAAPAGPRSEAPAREQAAPAREQAAPAPTESSQAPQGAPSDEAAALVDPWASVPLQTVAPTRPVAPPPRSSAEPRAASAPPLLDPWAGAAARHVPRQLDPELRDPFLGMRRHPQPMPRLRFAMADLRDPFARRSGAPRRSGAAAEPSAGTRGVTRVAPPATGGVPLHPDLRDPFSRRKARPAAPAPAAAPTPPTPTPPAQVAPPPSPRADRLGRPFAHPSRAARPA